ncbi:MAG: insulinase family protein, partial [Treponema sp.]|nr:insulinase family protein [Treponema sp.]
ADFSDEKRVRDLVLEMKNQYASSLSSAGSRYALSRACRHASAASRTGETWHGLSQLLFVNDLAKMEMPAIIARLDDMRAAIASSGVVVSLTGESGALRANAAAFARRFGDFGAPAPRRKEERANASACAEPAREVFASPSLQVGFAAMALPASAFDSDAQAGETALAHHLSNGALWEDIRMKGGAYGVGASNDSLEGIFSFSTYRDPEPLRSLDSFLDALKKPRRAFGSAGLTESDLEKTIIGCYARSTRPRSPAEKGCMDFMRFLYGIEDGYRARFLKRLINTSAADLSSALAALAAKEPMGRAVIAGLKDAPKIAGALGVEARELPF